jgi:hypothetical protein
LECFGELGLSCLSQEEFLSNCLEGKKEGSQGIQRDLKIDKK